MSVICFPDLNTPQLQPHWKRVYAARKAVRTKTNRYGESWEWESPLLPAEEVLPVGKGRYCGVCEERKELHIHADTEY